jgi:murein DD-endopeptidase MepM/ murein hydrolase activator NlpD
MSHPNFHRLRRRAFGLIVTGFALFGVGAASESALATGTESAKLVRASFAPMQPVFQSGPLLPKSRPDPAFLYPAEPVEITLPTTKPNPGDVFPKSTMTVGEMIRQQTGRTTSEETLLKLRAGEGIGAVLRRGGYDANKIANAVAAVTGKVQLRRLQIGTEFQIAEHGFRFSVKSGRDVYVLDDPQSGWLALTAIRPVDRYMKFARGVVEGSIYKAAMATRVSESAFNEYVRVMGFSVDFQREIRAGDSFEMLYEISRDRLTSETVGTKLLYAGLILSGQELGFFSFEKDGVTSWYDEHGDSAARTLIRTPISGARLSSSFGNRKHPVSGFNAMHKGVDFAAPRGTPIIAAGDGVVREAGWKGSFGRYVRIRHNGTFDTAYAHMSRLAPHVRVGTQVKQGEVIGYVGATGRTTGAHLHYEVMVNNRQVNPMTVQLPTGKRIDAEFAEAFRLNVARVDDELQLRGTNRFAEATAVPQN